MLNCSYRRNLILCCIGLVVVILAVYWQVGDHEFLEYDDDVYVTSNSHVTSGLKGTNIMWAFTSAEAANWHPVTWLSHMVDVELYDLNPGGHHLTNVAIHAVASILLLILLFRLTGLLWQSTFVAALFALHPQHVESVAWVAERKDVLSAFFGFSTLLLYTEYTRKRKPALYLLALFSFLLGLMSKPMLVPLPIVMLLMDFWPLNRHEGAGQEALCWWIAVIKEKIPFFIASLLSCIITIYAQHEGGATSSLAVYPFLLRLQNAVVAYVTYVVKTLWPHYLAVLYPMPSSLPLWQVIGSLLVLVLISTAVVKYGRRYPHLLVGWLWFLITLLPVIGLIHVGRQSMADRYSYIPSVGLFVMAAWGVPILVRNLQHRKIVLSFLAGAAITASATLTWHQLGFWRDSIHLFEHTLQITSDNVTIHNNLGLALFKKGDVDAAIQEFQKAIRIDVNDSEIVNNLGFALLNKGNVDAAIYQFKKAIRMSREDIKAHSNLSLAYLSKGNVEAAIYELQEALRISPNDQQVQNELRYLLEAKK